VTEALTAYSEFVGSAGWTRRVFVERVMKLCRGELAKTVLRIPECKANGGQTVAFLRKLQRLRNHQMQSLSPSDFPLICLLIRT
jgi:hypothetical protein